MKTFRAIIAESTADFNPAGGKIFYEQTLFAYEMFYEHSRQNCMLVTANF
jgi:hypothetical protein